MLCIAMDLWQVSGSPLVLLHSVTAIAALLLLRNGFMETESALRRSRIIHVNIPVKKNYDR